MRIDQSSYRVQLAVAAVLFALATVWMTWPLTPRAGSVVQDAGDPLYQIWTMRAVQHRLVHDPLDLYQANIFYPFDNTLAFAEEMISNALLGWPVYLVTGNQVLAYNLVVLFSFWFMAFAVYLLARELGAHPGAAFIAGIVSAFAPARYSHLPHLNLLVFGWLPLAMWALTVFVRGGPRWYIAIVGVALAAQLLASLHIAVFGTLALGAYALCLLLFERRKRLWVRRDIVLLAVAIIVPYLLFAVTLLPHLAVGDEYGFTRARSEVERYSATPGSYLSVSLGNHVWIPLLEGRPVPFFPGAVALVGAGLSVLAWRRWTVWFSGLISAALVVLSFGFAIHVAGQRIPMPYALLYDLFSPLESVRSVSRFGLLTVIFVPLLAAIGYSAAWQRLRGRFGQHMTVAGIALTAGLALIACIELRSSVGTWEVPDDPETVAVYEWLAGQPRGPVIEFPADGLLKERTDINTGVFEPIRYMYYSTYHWMPVVAGYSSFIPDEYRDLVQLFRGTETSPSMVSADNVGILQDLGVRWVIIHDRPNYDSQTARAVAGKLPQLRRVVEVGDSVVYEVAVAERYTVTQNSTIELASQVNAGWFYTVRVRLVNPNPNLALAHLERDTDLRITWLRLDGSVASEERIPLSIPEAAPPGETVTNLQLTAPDEPGDYRLLATVGGDVIPPAEQLVTVTLPRVERDEPLLRLESIDWDRSPAPQPGDTLHVEVSWRVLSDLGADFAATLQVLDGAGERVGGIDLLPDGAMPPTSTWRVGDLVKVGFDLQLDPALPPGEYKLLTAMYAYQPGYPRLTIALPDGSVADAAVVTRLSIGR